VAVLNVNMVTSSIETRIMAFRGTKQPELSQLPDAFYRIRQFFAP
jgi:hypothetical protein